MRVEAHKPVVIAASFLGFALVCISGLWCFYQSPYLPAPPRTTVNTGMVLLSLAFSPDSKLMAGAGQQGDVKIWETASGAEWFFKPGTGRFSVHSVAFSPDGTTFAWPSGRTIQLLELNTKRIVSVLENDDDIYYIAFTPDSKSLAAATLHPGIVRIWDLDKKKARVVWRDQDGSVGSIAIDPKGKTLGVGRSEEVVFINIATGAVSHERIRGLGGVSGLAYSPKGDYLTGDGYSRRGAIWDAQNGKELMNLAIPKDATLAPTFAFSPDGGKVALGFGHGVRKPSFLKIFDLARKCEVACIQCHDQTGIRLAWSPDGKTLATCARDGNLKLWNAEDLWAKEPK